MYGGAKEVFDQICCPSNTDICYGGVQTPIKSL
jgi:hypothetical protein